MGISYGLSYKGSKNRIAEQLVSQFPQAQNFYDLFIGGGAVTHACILRKNYKNYFINDIREGQAQFFVDCINGRYYDRRKEWISHKQYAQTWANDIYTRTFWSFRANAGSSYIYNTNFEELKHAHHLAAICDDYSLFDAMNIDIPRLSGGDTHTRVYTIGRYIERNYNTIISKFTAWRKSLGLPTAITSGREDVRGRVRWTINHYVQLNRLRNLEQLPTLKGQSMPHIEATQLDYRQIDILPDSVVYCDIPYRGTTKYHGTPSFDYEAFYDWACSFSHRPDVYILISEYSMP